MLFGKGNPKLCKFIAQNWPKMRFSAKKWVYFQSLITFERLIQSE